MMARDIMSTKVSAVPPSAPVEEVLRIMVESKTALVLVVDEEGNVLGVVTDHDLMYKAKPLLIPPRSVIERIKGHHDAWEKFRSELRKALGETAGEIMSTPPFTVEETMPVSQLAELMIERNLKQVPVVANGRLVGIVTRADILRALLEHKL
jgi:CBS domain-containing protein